MSIPELVKTVTEKGAVLILDGPKVRVRGVSRLDAQTVETLRRNGKELVIYLKSKAPAPCGSPACSGCYELWPGVKVHPPRCSLEWIRWRELWKELKQ